MHPFTELQYQRLLRNGKNRDQDHPPVALLFLTNTRCVWLISEVNPEYPDQAFGLCDLGMGFPELGYVSVEEMMLTQSENDFVLLINDQNFQTDHPMSVFQKAARQFSRIVADENVLKGNAPKP